MILRKLFLSTICFVTQQKKEKSEKCTHVVWCILGIIVLSFVCLSVTTQYRSKPR